MELKGWSVRRAAQHIVERKLVPMGGSGGLIAIDGSGNIARCFSGAGMYYAHRADASKPLVAIYAEH
jgi:beta-aspartyl-peptidase (threonine type)